MKLLDIFHLLPDSFKEIGVWGIIGLVVTSISVTIISELIFRYRQTKKYEFIKLTIELTIEGSRHDILAPLDIKISAFIPKLAKFLESEHEYKHLTWSLNFSKATILVKKNNRFERLDNGLTLREVGLKNNDICRIENYKIDKDGKHQTVVIGGNIQTITVEK